MDRRLIAYLLIALLVAAVALVIMRVRYNSRGNVLRRRRRADETRWESRRNETDRAGELASPKAGKRRFED